MNDEISHLKLWRKGYFNIVNEYGDDDAESKCIIHVSGNTNVNWVKVRFISEDKRAHMLVCKNEVEVEILDMEGRGDEAHFDGFTIKAGRMGKDDIELEFFAPSDVQFKRGDVKNWKGEL